MAEDSDPHAKQESPDKPRRRGPSKGAIILLLIGIPAMLAGTYYWPEVSNFAKLRAWSKRAPRETVARFVDALKANNVAAAQEASSPEYIKIRESDGQISSVVVSTEDETLPPIPRDSLIPSQSANEGAVRYYFGENHGYTVVSFATESGFPLEFEVKPIGGKWVVYSLMAPTEPVAVEEEPSGRGGERGNRPRGSGGEDESEADGNSEE